MHAVHYLFLLGMVMMCSSERHRLVFDEPSQMRARSPQMKASSYYRRSNFGSNAFDKEFYGTNYPKFKYPNIPENEEDDDGNLIDSNFMTERPHRKYPTNSNARQKAESYVNYGNNVRFPDDYKLTIHDRGRDQRNENPPAKETPTSFSYDDDSPNGPSNWGKFSKVCELGKRQSPVSILSDEVHLMRIDGPLRFEDIAVYPKSINIENNGHSVKFTFDYGNRKKPRIHGGPLKKSTYVVDSLHFHWGPNDYDGSEHELDNRKFASELHIVTYKSEYQSMTEASQKPDGLSVLAYFFENPIRYRYKRNSNFTGTVFVRHLNRVQNFGSSITLSNAQDLFTIKDIIYSVSGKYLTYKGSLTTPGCNEAVTWVIMTKPLKIFPEEMSEFRKLRDSRGELILNNCRPLQQLNNRKIFTNYY